MAWIRSAQQLPVHFRLPIIYTIRFFGSILREGLAQKWEVSEDGLTLTFHLRPDVRFHNGDICDAQAVVASFQRLKEEESPRAADYANYTFSVQDADTVVVTCEALDVAALSNFAYPWSAPPCFGLGALFRVSCPFMGAAAPGAMRLGSRIS